MYENFNASSIESLDSIFNRLQKNVSQLAILGENISQEDLNIKFLRSLPAECTNEIDTANTHDNTANLSDATVYAFQANQPNGSQLVHEDLEQIYEDDLKEMDLKWQLALLSMSARRYFQKTSKKITINGSDTTGYDKTKVECFNCHKMGHFAMVAIDGAGFNWSYMADDEVLTNMALMDFSDSEFNKSKFDLATYKRGLASVEEQLVFYKKNEVVFCDQIVVFKRDASFRDLEITALNLQIEKLKKEKESNQTKIDNFENASKSLDKLIGSIFAPLSIDLSNSSLKEFKQPEFKGYGPKDSKSVCIDTSNEIKKAPDNLIIKDWVSNSDDDESEEMVLKSDNVQHKPKQANQPRKVSQNPKNNRINWNEMSTQKLGFGFQFHKKACFVCGSFIHLIKDCDFHDKKM
nr:ribonuclease H-like domain-containing protein [Tanacetum cinerariifolium]